MSVLQFLSLLSLLAAPSIASPFVLDSEQKEFIVQVIQELREKAKTGMEIPGDMLRDFALDILPEDTEYTAELYKSLTKPTLVFHKDGRLAVIDSVKGEEVTLISPGGELDEDVFAKIFNADFVQRFEELHEKIDFVVKQIKRKRKEAMGGQDIVHVVLDKKFTFFNNGSVLVETDKAEVITKMSAEVKINENIIDTIFTVDEIDKIQVEEDEKVEDKGAVAVGDVGSGNVEQSGVLQTGGKGRVTQSVLVCVLALGMASTV